METSLAAVVKFFHENFFNKNAFKKISKNTKKSNFLFFKKNRSFLGILIFFKKIKFHN